MQNTCSITFFPNSFSNTRQSQLCTLHGFAVLASPITTYSFICALIQLLLRSLYLPGLLMCWCSLFTVHKWITLHAYTQMDKDQYSHWFDQGQLVNHHQQQKLHVLICLLKSVAQFKYQNSAAGTLQQELWNPPEMQLLFHFFFFFFSKNLHQNTEERLGRRPNRIANYAR